MREDSGVIDLFAIHERAKAAPSEESVPRDLFSSPPPAFTTDLYSDPGLHQDDVDDPENPFAKQKSKALLLGGAAAALVVVVVMIAAFSGGSADKDKATAAAKSEITASPAPTVPPVVVAPLPVASVVASNVPAPPTTGAPVATQKAAPRGARSSLPGAPAKGRPAVASGPKLTKIPSGGVANK